MSSFVTWHSKEPSIDVKAAVVTPPRLSVTVPQVRAHLSQLPRA